MVQLRAKKGRIGDGGLREFSQALVRPARVAEEAVAPPPPPAPPAPSAPPADPLTEFQVRVDRVLARIATAARSPGMKGDPYWREIFIAQAAQVELMPELVKQIHAARVPLSDEGMAALVNRVGDSVDRRVKRESSRWFRAFDRRTNAVIACAIGGAFVTGCLLGFATAFRLIAG